MAPRSMHSLLVGRPLSFLFATQVYRTMKLNRLSILGVGLLGGSIGLAVKSMLNGCRVMGYGHRTATLKRALEIGAIDEAYDRPGDAVRDSELVILCTPVGRFESLLMDIAGSLPQGVVITDVGSTKVSVVQTAERILPKQTHFVGSHPMAGSEKRGVEFARADLFRGALCIITPTDQSNPTAMKTVEEFWQLLGMRVTRLSPSDHDRLLADISHLPHAVAAALVDMQEETALNLAGKGFLDTTRVASGDGGLWRDIFLDNRTNVRASIQKLKERLDQLMAMLDRQDGDKLQAWLDRVATRREDLVQKKLREMGGE